jgi:hypothetical protein
VKKRRGACAFLLSICAVGCGARSALDLIAGAPLSEPDAATFDSAPPDAQEEDAPGMDAATVFDAEASSEAEASPEVEAAPPVLDAPRPLAPLSTATVTSQTPILHWALVRGEDGAMVDVCQDRACSTTVVTFSASGSSGTVPFSLKRGVYYWRLRGRAGSYQGTATSPVWEFFVGARSAPRNLSWGTTLDVNGDGLADALVSATLPNGFPGPAFLYLGGTTWNMQPPMRFMESANGADFGTSVASAGDVNGDGFDDMIIGARGAVLNYGPSGLAYVYLGSKDGPSAMPIALADPIGPGSAFGGEVAGAGDVNGDGYSDVVVGA